MAYQALYRKYRPSTFEEMAGQKQIVQTLKNAVANDRVSHAYLFCGPRGTGKTSAAKIFARALNCTGDDTRPCGHCENCMAADHPDIIEIDAASNNGVEEARNLVERVKYAPMLGKYKIYIIDEVHMMTAGAFNALLKTIEEPPAHVVFILATTEPHKVLPTILSRCQRFDFKKVPDDQIRDRLMSVASLEGTELDPEAADTIASLAEGGMRDALSILDQCIAYEPDHLTSEDVRSVYGVVSPADIAELFKNLYEGKAELVMDEIKKVYDDGMDLERLTADLITMLKDSLILHSSPHTTLLTPERKELINQYFMISPLPWRKELLKSLMDIYPQFPFASSVLDYLESVLLRFIGANEVSDSVLPDKSTDSLHEKPDKTSEYSDMKSRNVQKSKSESKKLLNTESDVSRETSLKKETHRSNPKKIRYSTEDIVGLLHIADKEMRKQDMNAWKNKESYLSSLEFGKFANLIQNASLAASGKDYIVVYTSRDLEVDAINELQEEIGFEEFIKKMTGTAKQLVAVSSQQYKESVEMFRICMSKGEFPAAPEIHLKQKAVNQSSSTEEALRKIFPDLKVVND